MVKAAVINASPLIFLSRSNHSNLLQLVAERLMVPSPVADEIRRRGPTDTTATLLRTAKWIETVAGVTVPPMILKWGLGAGESAVLAHAHANAGMEAIIDDLMGRKCARVLGIPVRGTLGIVLQAKRDGHIPNARRVIEELISGGMYLSRSVIDEALKRVNE